ncbi:MAG TPA: hypothetical protein VK972_05400, partial [Wenzhouxiangella sp.]|nr:hypothetical protein [Wenzhouxiangella sp.]
MRRVRMALIGTAAAGWALAGLAGEAASGRFGNDDGRHGHAAASETLSDKAWPFVSGQGYQVQTVEKVNDAIEGALEIADGSSVFLPSGMLDPFVKAVLALDQTEGRLERVRFRLRYGQDEASAPPAAAPVPVSFVQIERFNLGPAVREALVQAHGAENVAAAAEFGVGPHVSWRLVTRPVMGQQADIVAVSRREISDADARAQTCFHAPCLSTAPVIKQAAPWSAMEATELEADVPYRTER